MTWIARPSTDPELDRRLRGHPGFTISGEPTKKVLFARDGWNREIIVGRPGRQAVNGSLYGLPELADNNPLVCADLFSVPSPEATLALIGLGPLVRAGLIVEDPVVQLSFDPAHGDIGPALAELGWQGDVVIHADPQALGSVLAAVCMAEIEAMPDYSELDSLFEEAFGRSFFIRGVDALTWDVEHVRGWDNAVYTLRVSPFEDRALVTVLVMADKNGKCGAGQIVHAMNVMCGFEECLGLSVPVAAD